MKFVLAGLAVVAAVAALFFRPPHSIPESSAAAVAPGPRAYSAAATPDNPERLAARSSNGREGRRPNPARIVVYVAGEVNKPGVYSFAYGTRAQDALARAGGPKPDADLVAVNLAAPLNDGAEIAVPKIGAATSGRRRPGAPRARASHRPRVHGRRHGVLEAAPGAGIDLNAADESELETLPGIGPSLAARIIAYRESNGPFTSVDELADVAGITPRLQDNIADRVIIR